MHDHRAMRVFGPPVKREIKVPNEEALREILDSLDINKLHVGPTMRRIWRGMLTKLSHELARRGVRAPGYY